MRLYPEAKVVLTVRQSDKWADSIMNTIGLLHPYSPRWGVRVVFNNLLRGPGNMIKLMWPKFAQDEGILSKGKIYDKEYLMKKFDDYNENVKRQCPPDKVLVFDVKDGWTPLCAFLGKPVPDVPFPHANETAEMLMTIGRMNALGWVLSAFLIPAIIS